MPMPQTIRQRPMSPTAPTPASAPLATTGAAAQARRERPSDEGGEARGFGGGTASRAGRRRGGRKRSPALSRADWGPLGKHPDLDAIVARQRLHLPLSGRLTAAQVNQAWKRCASEHHPDRGGEHDTMQSVNGARDLLLGRTLD